MEGVLKILQETDVSSINNTNISSTVNRTRCTSLGKESFSDMVNNIKREQDEIEANKIMMDKFIKGLEVMEDFARVNKVDNVSKRADAIVGQLRKEKMRDEDIKRSAEQAAELAKDPTNSLSGLLTVLNEVARKVKVPDIDLLSGHNTMPNMVPSRPDEIVSPVSATYAANAYRKNG
jgi:replicative superfamily II helicase